jgi:hypothetical protein
MDKTREEIKIGNEGTDQEVDVDGEVVCADRQLQLADRAPRCQVDTSQTSLSISCKTRGMEKAGGQVGGRGWGEGLRGRGWGGTGRERGWDGGDLVEDAAVVYTVPAVLTKRER